MILISFLYSDQRIEVVKIQLSLPLSVKIGEIKWVSKS